MVSKARYSYKYTVTYVVKEIKVNIMNTHIIVYTRNVYIVYCKRVRTNKNLISSRISPLLHKFKTIIKRKRKI